ncbi:hypothetical protein GCM10010531_39060 [Blastococcus jejuensis]|uniref:ATP-grasp target RiPP n=1 Tax=Blastococcus jejuensis TaxID=351224 RepID=A0ABP6PJY6_9ACTN
MDLEDVLQPGRSVSASYRGNVFPQERVTIAELLTEEQLAGEGGDSSSANWRAGGPRDGGASS